MRIWGQEGQTLSRDLTSRWVANRWPVAHRWPMRSERLATADLKRTQGFHAHWAAANPRAEVNSALLATGKGRRETH